MIWEIAVQVVPPAIFGRIYPHDRRALPGDRAAVDLQVLAAAQRCGGSPRVDRNLLTTAGAQFPQVRHGQAHRRQAGRRGVPDAEGRREYRIISPRNLNLAGKCAIPSGNRQQLLQSVVHRHCEFSLLYAVERFYHYCAAQ